jgi:Zn-dependent protease
VIHELAVRAVLLVPLLLSLGVHEWAHAVVAFHLGDTTAEEQGRLTLNPFAHVDPVGTLALPLLGVPFGWAKPVPIDPTRFRQDVPMSRGVLLTAAAGPAANAVLAVLCALAALLIGRFAPRMSESHSPVAFLVARGLVLNVTLAVFNVLPIPPLDGGRIVDALVPFEWRGAWARVSSLGTMVLLALFLAPRLLGFDIVGPLAKAAWHAMER